MAETRVLAEGQWLGTRNRIIIMRWFYRYGWTATDSTGERYCQRIPGGGGLTYGLKTADYATDCVALPRTPWPKEPKK